MLSAPNLVRDFLAKVSFSNGKSAKFDWKLIAVLVFGVFHSTFPTFFINLVFFNHIVLVPASRGVAYHFGRSELRIHWDAFNHLFFSLPPLLSFLASLGLIGTVLKKGKNSIGAIAIAFVIMLSWASLFTDPKQPNVLMEQSLFKNLILVGPCILFIFFSLSLLTSAPIFFFWLTGGFLPIAMSFIGVDVYFAYINGVLAAVLLIHTRMLLLYLKNMSSRRKLATNLYRVACGLLLLIFFDQYLNLNSAYQAFHASYISAKTIAAEIAADQLKLTSDNLQTQKPKTVAIANTLLLDDIHFHLRRNHKMYLDLTGYTFSQSIPPDSPSNLSQYENFEKQIKKRLGNYTIYTLDVERPDLIGSTTLSDYVDRAKLSVKTLYRDRVDVKYPYADFLKLFIPERYITYPGSPDLGRHVNVSSGILHRRIHSNLILDKVINR